MASIHSALADFLDQRREAITTEWLSRVRADQEIPSADGLPREELLDHMPFLLTALIERLRGTRHATDETERQSQTHGVTRQEQDYRLPELLREVSILRKVLIAKWDEFDATGGGTRPAQLESSSILHAILDEVIAESTIGFVAHGQEKLVAANLALERSNLRMQALNAQLADHDDRRLQMLRTITHEVANHLNATGFMVADLKKSPDAATSGRAVDILRSIASITALMKQLLEYSTLAAAEETVVPIALDVPAFLEEMAAFGRSLAAAKNLAFVEELDGVTGPIVTDPDLLRRICFNLLTNAAKYTAEGRMRLAAGAQDESRWWIEVSDTGCGIAPEDHARVFTEFYRGAETRGMQDGIGLGLAIARQLAALLGGVIELESAVGAGSTFRLVLPRR